MNTLFRKVSIEEVSAAHFAYMSVYEWLNAKGVRQWLRPLSQETFVDRQRDGQLFGLYIDKRMAAVVTLAFEVNPYGFGGIGYENCWGIKSLAFVRVWRGAGMGKRVMKECKAPVRDMG